MARTLPQPPPATTGSPTRSVPRSTSTVATGPRPWSRLDSSTNARAGASRIGAERRVVEVGDEQDRLEELVHADARARGHLVDDGVATPLLGNQLLLHQLLADAVGVRVLAVDLGDRDHDRDLGRARVVDRLDGLGHHAVVGRDHEDRDVGGVGAPLAHRGERLVTRGVDESDRTLVAHHLVRADVLGDATGLARDDVRRPDRVQQRGLAVVDVSHHGHDRRTRREIGLLLLVRVVTEQRHAARARPPGPARRAAPRHPAPARRARSSRRPSTVCS